MTDDEKRRRSESILEKKRQRAEHILANLLDHTLAEIAWAASTVPGEGLVLVRGHEVSGLGGFLVVMTSDPDEAAWLEKVVEGARSRA